MTCKTVPARSFGSFHSSNINEQLKVADTNGYVPPKFPVSLTSFDELKKSSPEFGWPIKEKHFMLDNKWTFLNHGAFGAVLKDALKTCQNIQNYVEAQPVRFIDRELFPQLVSVHFRLARFIGCQPSDFVIVQNATQATNSVLESLNLNENSRIYHLSTIYGAVNKCVRKLRDTSGATVQTEKVVFPIESEEDIIDLVKSTLKLGTTIALFDHIPSNTPFVLPVKKLVEVCHDKNVPVLIDGAHALGQLHLDLHDIGADYYVTNAHKWFCSPKGVALLYVKPELQPSVRALSVSHGYNSGFHSELAFTGLRDFAPCLAMQCCLNFWLAVGPDVLRTRMRTVLKQAAEALLRKWNGHLLAPLSMCASMCCVSLPSALYEGKEVTYDDAEKIQNRLYHDYQIEVPFKVVQNELYVRISVHIYNELSEYEKLAEAVLDLVP